MTNKFNKNKEIKNPILRIFYNKIFISILIVIIFLSVLFLGIVSGTIKPLWYYKDKYFNNDQDAILVKPVVWFNKEGNNALNASGWGVNVFDNNGDTLIPDRLISQMPDFIYKTKLYLNYSDKLSEKDINISGLKNNTKLDYSFKISNIKPTTYYPNAEISSDSFNWSFNLTDKKAKTSKYDWYNNLHIATSNNIINSDGEVENFIFFEGNAPINTPLKSYSYQDNYYRINLKENLGKAYLIKNNKVYDFSSIKGENIIKLDNSKDIRESIKSKMLEQELKPAEVERFIQFWLPNLADDKAKLLFIISQNKAKKLINIDYSDNISKVNLVMGIIVYLDDVTAIK